MSRAALFSCLLLLFFSGIASAAVLCPEYCSRGVHYFNGTLSTRLVCSYKSENCSLGCDSAGEKCLQLAIITPAPVLNLNLCANYCSNGTKYTAIPSATASGCPYQKLPCASGSCNRNGSDCAEAACAQSCEGSKLKYDGKYDSAKEVCSYLVKNCTYGCEKGACKDSPQCPAYCSKGTLYYNGNYETNNPLVAGCVYDKKTCYAGCGADNKSCNKCSSNSQCGNYCESSGMHTGICSKTTGECSWQVAACGKTGCNANKTACSTAECTGDYHCASYCGKTNNSTLYSGKCLAGKCTYSAANCQFGCDKEKMQCSGCTTSKQCPEFCKNSKHYSQGKCDLALGECKYMLSLQCNYGCNASSGKCASCTSDSQCEADYCGNGEIHDYSCSKTTGKCEDKKTICAADTCHPNKEMKCGWSFGRAHVLDDTTGVDQPIANAHVSARWLDKAGGLRENLPDRATGANGEIDFTNAELYKYNDGKLEATVALIDFDGRFEVMDAQSNVLDNANNWQFGNADDVELTRSVEPAKSATYDRDFEFTGNLRRFGKIYFHNQEVADFSENQLNTPINLLTPESVYVDSDGTGSAMHSVDKSIPVTWDAGVHYSPADSNLNNGDSPENLEWHEFCHHIMADQFDHTPARAGGCCPPACACGTGGNDCNHCGYDNPNSLDSWVEGWAEFCALMTKDHYGYPQPSVYAGFANLETNLDVNIDDEELAIASILWDLYDGAAGDGVDLTVAQVWGVLGTQHNFAADNAIGYAGGNHQIQNLYEIYLAFDASNLPGIHGDTDNDGRNNLDEIFIEHSAYSDDNGDGNWDAGEDIGYTLDAAGNIRFSTGTVQAIEGMQKPRKPGAYIKLNLVGPKNELVENATAHIKVKFSGDCGLGENCDYEYYFKPGAEGLLYMEPPPKRYNTTVEVEVEARGEKLPAIKFYSQDFWKGYTPAKKFVYAKNLKFTKELSAAIIQLPAVQPIVQQVPSVPAQPIKAPAKGILDTLGEFFGGFFGR